jgi:2,3-bisphosphoglycerate-independent phosphoglycerate mutase
VIIADHGNSDMMINPDGSPNTAHTKNPVPVIYVAQNAKEFSLRNGRLADIAPTLLYAMDIKVPAPMDGVNLLEKK